MPRPKLISDEQICAAARQVFCRVGVNAQVSLIAKPLGVTPAALFHRTGTKERLFVWAMTDATAADFNLLRQLRAGPSGDSPIREQLSDALVRLSAHLAVVSPNTFLLFAAGKWQRDAQRDDLPRLTRRHLADWLRRAKQHHELKLHSAGAMAEALVGSLEARHLYRYLDGKGSSVATERRYVRRLVEGLLDVAPPVAAPAGRPTHSLPLLIATV